MGSFFLLRRFLVCFTLFFALSYSASAEYSLNDVSLLLPLPKTAEDLKTNFLNAQTPLSTGALVSSQSLKLMDWTTVQADLNMTVRANIDRLAVISIRLDPCFKDHFSDPCRPQIRLIMQPIVFGGALSDTADLGIHLFFDTTRDQILNLIRFSESYRSQFLGANSFKAPLQVQPVIQQEGMGGKYWQTLKLMLQNTMNQSVFSRIAFFVVQPSGRAWSFRSFDIVGGVSKPIVIPGLGNSVEQRFDNQIQNSVIEFQATSGLIPRASQGSDQTFDFLINSTQFRRSNGPNPLPFFTTLSRIENPGAHLPGTIDCLSCHSTPAIKTTFRKNGITLPLDQARFMSVKLPQSALFNLFEDHFDSRDFKLFSYRNRNPTVGQRVINESASIVDALQ